VRHLIQIVPVSAKATCIRARGWRNRCGCRVDLHLAPRLHGSAQKLPSGDSLWLSAREGPSAGLRTPQASV